MDMSISVTVNYGNVKCAILSDLNNVLDTLDSPEFHGLFSDADYDQNDIVTITCILNARDVISITGVCQESQVCKYTMLVIDDIYRRLNEQEEDFSIQQEHFCDFTVSFGYATTI